MDKILSRSLLIVSLLFTLASCEEDPPYSQFAGTWEGDYTGDQLGTISITVDDEGAVKGGVTSRTFPAYAFPTDGQIANQEGYIRFEAQAFSNPITFEGRLLSNEATGSWVNQVTGERGLWSCSREL